MQQFFLILLILSGAAFVIQTVAGFMGFEDADLPSDGEAAGPFGFLTVRNMITFILGLSSGAYILMRAGFPPVISIPVGVLFGAILAGSVIAGMRLLMRLEQKNEIEPHEYRGLYATVVTRIEPERKSQGKVEFTLHERMEEMLAVTDEADAIKKGEQVQISKLLDNGVLLVKRLIIN